jgi:restriction endonuclease S subunit
MTGATVGKVALSQIDNYLLNQRVGLIRNNDSVLQNYLKALLFSDDFYNYCQKTAGGGAQGNISPKDIKNYTIPFPSLEVQREIVVEIEGYQKIIDGARQVVDNWKPQIEVDPDWPMVKLGEVCEINPKKSEVSALADNKIVSFLPMEDIGTIQDIYPKKERTISEVYKGYSYFRENDVLIAKVTPCFENGKSGIARNLKNAIGFGTTEIHVIRPSKKILPEYIYPFISSTDFLVNGKTQMTGTGGLQRLSAQYIANFEIPLSHLEIQKETVVKIESERKAVEGCRELIKGYEAKIKRVVDGVWGE